MTVHAIHGAIQVDANEAAAIQRATVRLQTELMTRNDLRRSTASSASCSPRPQTSTPPFPRQPRGHGFRFDDVPLTCASEINVAGALPRVVRLIADVETSRPRGHIRHVYLAGAKARRPDLRN